MEEIKNKRISKDLIKNILHEMYDYNSKIYAKYQEHQTKKQSSQYGDYTRNGYIVTSKPSIDYTIYWENYNERKSDNLEWMLEQLDTKTSKINTLISSFSHIYSYYNNNEKEQEISESLYFHLSKDSISVNFRFENASDEFMELKDRIEALISKAPKNYDKTMKHKSSRLFIPSVANGLLIGLIAGIALFSICKYTNYNIYINNFILGKLFIPSILFISINLGLFLPNKNHFLYKAMKLKKRLFSSDDDIRQFLNYCEVEIGDFHNRGKLRQEIENTYSSSKTKIIIRLILFAIFFYITIL